MISKAVEFFAFRSSFFTFLWQVLVNQHGFLYVPYSEDGKGTEEHHGAPVQSGIAHGESIEDVHLVNHVVVTHREELPYGLYG